jgi:PAS domain S-box-containing protein
MTDQDDRSKHAADLRQKAETLATKRTALKLSEERYRRITEGLTDYSYTVHLENGQVVQTTHGSACVAVTGYTAEEFAADPYLWIRMVVPEDRDLVREHVRQVLAGQKTSPLEHRIVRKDGYVRWINDTAVLNIDDNGILISYDGLIKDITDRKMIEQTLRESEDVFKTLAEQCPISIMRFDRHGRVTFVNDWHMKKFACNRLSKDFYIGKSLHELPGLVKSGINHEVSRMFSGETVEISEVFFPEITGTALPGWVSILGVPIIKDGVVMGGILIREDLSQRKKVEEIIKSKNEQLQIALAEKDKFFSIIAHDLRSPLSGFLGLTRMMAEGFEGISLKELHNVSMQMVQSAENLFTLLDNLLEWSRMQRKMTGYAPSVCTLDEIIRQNMELVQAMAGQKSITLQNNVADNFMVFADQHMLNTVIRNLLANAVKFTPPGGIVVVSADLEEDMARVAVQDTGIGMDQETLSGLFLLTCEKQRTGTAGERGTGLGLILSKEFVEKHGGEIWAESEPGKGTTVFFTLSAA